MALKVSASSATSSRGPLNWIRSSIDSTDNCRAVAVTSWTGRSSRPVSVHASSPAATTTATKAKPPVTSTCRWADSRRASPSISPGTSTPCTRTRVPLGSCGTAAATLPTSTHPNHSSSPLTSATRPAASKVSRNRKPGPRRLSNPAGTSALRPASGRDPVPGAHQGLDDAGLPQLRAQSHHRDPNGGGERIRVLVPHPFQQLLGADHRATRGQQHLQHPELLAGQLDLPPRTTHRSAGRVELQLVGHQQRWLRGRGTATERADPSGQLRERERLGQVVVGAQGEAGHPVLDRATGSEHDHAGELAGSDHLPAQLVTRHARQVPVEHDHVVAGDAGLLVPL